MPERQDVILGAGLTGLTAALTLQEAGETHWVVLEKEERPGGHARSIAIDGYVFDFGPHILFTSDQTMEALIRDLLGDNLRSQERQAFIYHALHGLYTRFPFQAHLYGLPSELVRDCLVGLVEAVENRARGQFQPKNYEEWMRGFFGDGIAERLMIPYARKLWTVEPDSMDFTWIERRVPTPDVERVITGAPTDQVDQVGATAQFWYPWQGGIEALARALADRVHGVQLSREMLRLDTKRRRIVLTDGEELRYEGLIFTLPLLGLPHWVPDLPSEVQAACLRLKYQGIFNVNLGIDRPDISELHWVYFYEEQFPFHRLSFPATFSPHNVPAGKGSIATEIAYSPDRRLDRDRLIEQTVAALRAAAILNPDDRVEVVHAQEIAPAYVIYDLDHARSVETILEWLAEQGIVAAGRFGQWQYLNMDQAMKSGQRAAEEIIAERGGSRARR
jgi:protoporphyrinogen oxidase